MSQTITTCALPAIVAFALAACGAADTTQNAEQSAPASGTAKTLPSDFQLSDSDAQPVLLGDLIGERIAVIDFWATWCKPCRKSLPAVQALAGQVPSERVAVIAINVGEKPDDQVAAFRAELGLTLPVAFDSDMALARALEISALPALIVVDQRGTVVHRGKALDATARARLDALLSQ